MWMSVWYVAVLSFKHLCSLSCCACSPCPKGIFPPLPECKVSTLGGVVLGRWYRTGDIGTLHPNGTWHLCMELGRDNCVWLNNAIETLNPLLRLLIGANINAIGTCCSITKQILAPPKHQNTNSSKVIFHSTIFTRRRVDTFRSREQSAAHCPGRGCASRCTRG